MSAFVSLLYSIAVQHPEFTFCKLKKNLININRRHSFLVEVLGFIVVLVWGFFFPGGKIQEADGIFFKNYFLGGLLLAFLI